MVIPRMEILPTCITKLKVKVKQFVLNGIPCAYSLFIYYVCHRQNFFAGGGGGWLFKVLHFFECKYMYIVKP